MSEFVSQHISYICPYIEKDKSGGGGAKVYTFGKVSSLEVQIFQKQSHKSYKEKVNVEEV